MKRTSPCLRSSQLPSLVPASEYDLAIRILTNFYNYLLLHDVFHPEREAAIVASIKACISLCNVAAKELPKVAQAGRQLPGDFNVAASVLSKGFHAGLWTGDEDWAKEASDNPYDDEVWGSGGAVGMSTSASKVVLSAGISACGTEEMFEAIQTFAGSLRCVEEREHIGLEVKELFYADQEVYKIYANYESVRKKLNIKALGRVVCDEWEIPSFQIQDIGKEAGQNVVVPRRYKFMIEDDILTMLFPGIKFEATLRKLAVGSGQDPPTFWTIDTISRTYCSFYTYLPNELMPKPSKPVRWLNDEEREQSDERETCEGNKTPDDDNDDAL